MFNKYPYEEVEDDFWYALPSGEYCALRYAQDYDCIFFEYAKNREDMEKGITIDGAWIYVPDCNNAEELFQIVEKQFMS